MEFFQSAYQYFDEATRTEVSVSHTAEWLLDNFYVLEQAIRHLEEDLPPAYYHRLPKTEDGELRIYILALAIMRQNNAHFDIEQIKNFIQKFQSVTPLSTGEIWALPMILRLTAMEALAEGLATITKLKWDATPRPALWKKIIASDSSDGILEQVSPQATAETLIVNSILNLRMLASQYWKSFFESTSVLEKILREDPAEVYAEMDFETRNRYRGVVEELARGSTVTESNVASQAIK